jgi:hypothetical protein
VRPAAVRRATCLVAAFVIVCSLCLAGCGGSDTAPAVTPTPAPTITGVVLSQSAVTIARHGTRQVTVTVTRSDGTTADVTDAATWISSNPETVSVQRGLLVAVTMGTAKITAGYGGYMASSDVVVRRNTVVRAWVDVSAWGIAGRVVAELDGKVFAECDPNKASYDCMLDVGYDEVPPGVDPGAHEVVFRYLPSGNTGKLFGVNGGGSLYVCDGDTYETLRTYTLVRTQLAGEPGMSVTWPFEVLSYR